MYKIVSRKMRNLVLLRNDHSNFTASKPFTVLSFKGHKQKEIIVHGLNLAIWDLISTKGNYSGVSWTSGRGSHGRYLGARNPELQPVLGIPGLRTDISSLATESEPSLLEQH